MPLSTQALQVLEDLKQVGRGKELLFPGERNHAKPMSNNTILFALYRMGDLDSVLLPCETLTEFVEASVRRAVEFRRVQTDFAARCDASLATYESNKVSIPSDVVLSKLEAKVAARVKQLRK